MTRREEMMMAIIRKYGFENEITIAFCEVCEDEKSTMAEIENIFEIL